MYVKPREGLTIIDPDRMDIVPAEGREVPDNQPYWHRRVLDGDMELCDPPVEEPAAEPVVAAEPARASRKSDAPSTDAEVSA